MSKRCKPPRCALVRNRCQCPNPWIEHLANSAARRRSVKLPRLSIKEHAKEYRRSLARYRPHKISASCKGLDTKLLCRWNASRRMNKSQQGENEGWERDLLTLQSKSIKKIDASASFGVHRDRTVVLKIFKGWEFAENFAYETKLHQRLCEKIPDKVPTLLKAYVLKKGNSLKGVHIMERLPGVLLEKLVPYFGTAKSVDLAQMATHFKKLFDALRKSRVFHGDPHAQNIFVDVDKTGNVRNIQVIDFGNSVMDVDIRNENMFQFLEGIIGEPKLELLIPYFRDAGLDVPHDILDWDEVDFEERTKYPGLRDEILEKSNRDVSQLEVVEE